VVHGCAYDRAAGSIQMISQTLPLGSSHAAEHEPDLRRVGVARPPAAVARVSVAFTSSRLSTLSAS